MTQYNMIIKFVRDELCNGNRDHNATAYDDDRFDGAMNVRISFEHRPLEQYNALLRFCADNDITIVNTHPATLETVVRVGIEDNNPYYTAKAKEMLEHCNYDSAVALMDDEIREAVHADLAPCSDLEFLAEYMKRHAEKYGEEFCV